MKINRSWPFLSPFVFLLTILGLSLQTGCASTDTAKWIEEVQLHDGTMIQVQRKARRQSSGFPTASRGALIDQEFFYAPLNAKWSNITGKIRFDPISFEIFEGAAYLINTIGSWESCEGKAKKDYAVQVLKWESDHWTEVSASEFPLDQALANLYRRYWGHDTDDDAKGLVSWEDKASRDGFLKGTSTGYEIAPKTVKAYLDRGRFFCSRFDVVPR